MTTRALDINFEDEELSYSSEESTSSEDSVPSPTKKEESSNKKSKKKKRRKKKKKEKTGSGIGIDTLTLKKAREKLSLSSRSKREDKNNIIEEDNIKITKICSDSEILSLELPNNDNSQSPSEKEKKLTPRGILRVHKDNIQSNSERSYFSNKNSILDKPKSPRLREEPKKHKARSESSKDSPTVKEFVFFRLKRKPKSKSEGNKGISMPYDLVHCSHVDQELNWSGEPENVFELQEKLGEGAFGTVYKGCHKGSGSIIAIKVLSDKDDAIEKEINLMKSMRNSAIVSYYGSFLLEYCSLGSLRDIIETTGTGINNEQLLKYITLQTLKGLIYLHSSGIVHRDLKAGNILVHESAEVKLCDFGISAKLSDGKSKRLQTTIGSPLWMAPEVIEEKEYNEAADIWSLGITLIELAEGLPPYAQNSILAVLRMIPKNDPPKLKDESYWSADFHDFVSKCLQKDPKKRPTSIDLLSHKFLSNVPDSSVLQHMITDYLILKEERKSASESESPNFRSLEKVNSDSENYNTAIINDVNLDAYSTTVFHDDAEEEFDTKVFNGKTSGLEVFSTTMINNSDDENSDYALALKLVQGNKPNIDEISNEIKQVKKDLNEFKEYVTNELQSQKDFITNALMELKNEIQNNKPK